MYRRAVAGGSVLYPVWNPLCTGKMWTDDKAHRKSGQDPEWWRAGKGTHVQAFEPRYESSSAGWTDKPSGCWCKRFSEESFAGIPGKHPSDLSWTGVLWGCGGWSLGYEPVDDQNLLKLHKCKYELIVEKWRKCLKIRKILKFNLK